MKPVCETGRMLILKSKCESAAPGDAVMLACYQPFNLLSGVSNLHYSWERVARKYPVVTSQTVLGHGQASRASGNCSGAFLPIEIIYKGIPSHPSLVVITLLLCYFMSVQVI